MQATSSLRKYATRVKKDEETALVTLKERLIKETVSILKSEQERLHNSETKVKLISPENLLKKGYSFTLKEGKIVRQSKELKKGETITTRFSDGQIESIVK